MPCPTWMVQVDRADEATIVSLKKQLQAYKSKVWRVGLQLAWLLCALPQLTVRALGSAPAATAGRSWTGLTAHVQVTVPAAGAERSLH